MCSGFLCCVCGLFSLSSWFFLWFLICELVQVLFFSLAANFKIFNSHFPASTLGLDVLRYTAKQFTVSVVPID